MRGAREEAFVKSRLLKILTPIFRVVTFCPAVWALHREVLDYHLREISQPVAWLLRLGLPAIGMKDAEVAEQS
jgi:hypothetical protein